MLKLILLNKDKAHTICLTNIDNMFHEFAVSFYGSRLCTFRHVLKTERKLSILLRWQVRKVKRQLMEL